MSVQRTALSVQENMKTTSYRDLMVWQKSYQLAILTYQLTSAVQGSKMSGLDHQIRRAAVSIPSNITEGYGRQYTKEYRQFLSIAYGSLRELETQYMLLIDLGFSKKDETVESLLREVGKMLYRLLHPVRSTLNAER